MTHRTYEPHNISKSGENVLDQNSIKEFQEIYRREFDIELSLDEASELAGRLLRFYKTIFKPSKGNPEHGKQN